MAAALPHVGWRSGNMTRPPARQWLRPGAVCRAVDRGALPPSAESEPALWLRLVVGFFTMARMAWAAHYVITRGGTLYRLIAALPVLLLCGLGFWWIEPTTPTFGDALWLAFTTAATVGYGDSVPTTPASKIFAVFVVFLGVGAITLVAAAIASAWIATEDRHIEREILDNLHKQLAGVRAELAALREAVQRPSPAAAARPTSRRANPGDVARTSRSACRRRVARVADASGLDVEALFMGLAHRERLARQRPFVHHAAQQLALGHRGKVKTDIAGCIARRSSTSSPCT